MAFESKMSLDVPLNNLVLEFGGKDGPFFFCHDL